MQGIFSWNDHSTQRSKEGMNGTVPCHFENRYPSCSDMLQLMLYVLVG
jgi:hypothetical protein